jgi:hypothetical protein
MRFESSTGFNVNLNYFLDHNKFVFALATCESREGFYYSQTFLDS